MNQYEKIGRAIVQSLAELRVIDNGSPLTLTVVDHQRQIRGINGYGARVCEIAIGEVFGSARERAQRDMDAAIASSEIEARWPITGERAA